MNSLIHYLWVVTEERRDSLHWIQHCSIYSVDLSKEFIEYQTLQHPFFHSSNLLDDWLMSRKIFITQFITVQFVQLMCKLRITKLSRNITGNSAIQCVLRVGDDVGGDFHHTIHHSSIRAGVLPNINNADQSPHHHVIYPYIMLEEWTMREEIYITQFITVQSLQSMCQTRINYRNHNNTYEFTHTWFSIIERCHMTFTRHNSSLSILCRRSLIFDQ